MAKRPIDIAAAKIDSLLTQSPEALPAREPKEQKGSRATQRLVGEVSNQKVLAGIEKAKVSSNTEEASDPPDGPDDLGIDDDAQPGPGPDEIDLEIDGEAIKLGKQEIAEWIRKAKAADESRESAKDIEEAKAALVEAAKMQDTYLEYVTEIRRAETQLKSLANTDWDKLRSEDPEYARSLREYRSDLKDALIEAKKELAEVQAQASSAEEKRVKKERANAEHELKRSIQGWGDKLRDELDKFAEDSGLGEAVTGKLNAAATKVLWKAYRYDQAKKSIKEKSVSEQSSGIKGGSTKVAAKSTDTERKELISKLRQARGMENMAAMVGKLLRI